MTRFSMLVVLMCVAAPVCAGDPTPEEFFEKHVRPVFVAKCLECHGDELPEGELRLTSRALLLKGGQSGPAAINMKPAESLLVKAIRQDGKLKMPPDEKLSPDEIAAISKWVEMGLPWPEASGIAAPKKEMVVTDADRKHWSFRPVLDPVAPPVKDTAWPHTSIDRFVLAKLEEAGLKPSPTAGRRTLIRRAYYDLIGLPPSWDDVQAFLNDPAETSVALETVIDRLLASPRYGERWARHWLDVARFADTKDGVLMYGDDRVRPYAYTYRDYVIRAFDEDLPYDRFVQEQLAADMIEPQVEPWRLAAMGYLTLGRMFDNNIHDIIDDQIDTVSRGFLGLTVACARCHDHKYDPIPTADYYSLYGVFASCEVPLELPLTDGPEKTPGGPEFEKEAAVKRADLLKFRDQQFDLLSDTARMRVGDYLTKVATTKPDPLETAIFFLSLAPEDLRAPITARWRRYLEQRGNSQDPVFGPWAELLELPEPTVGADGKPDVAATEAFVTGVASVLERWKARGDGTQPGQLNPLVREALLKSPLTDRTTVARVYGDLLKRVYEESKSATAAAGTASPPVLDDARKQLLEVLVSRDSPAYFPKSQTRRYMSRGETDAFSGKMQELDRMAVKSPNAPPRAMVVQDADAPYNPRIFVRGNATQQGRHIPRQFLELLTPGGRTPFPKGSGRLDLARAIASPQNPLTARVMVNRVWMYHFGEPLVSTPSDFGNRSNVPTHPELLDHLATRFMQEGWSLKKLHRWIMTSNSYQQASTADAKSRTVDPDNRLLWKANRQRLDFEAMRDTLLAVSGRLETRSGGRPVDIANDPQSRVRTIFGLIDRQSLPGTFRAFDFASPDQSIERRSRTMVPQQALFAINSPFVVVQAKALAARPEVASATDPAVRITATYRVALERDPNAQELAESLAFVKDAKDEQSQLTVWEQLAQVLLSSNELMYLD
ncbi:MAG: Planctomycete cytochrome [Planctomycetaceae bacterium]|nr:Planctomycete cytochrome [Planctomycetaceae bacterium]